MNSNPKIPPHIYDQIYQEPWVYYTERYTIMKSILNSDSFPPLSLLNKVILDLNVRTGYFMRMFLYEGVERYIGLDKDLDYIEYVQRTVSGKFPDNMYTVLNVNSWNVDDIEDMFIRNEEEKKCDVAIGSLVMSAERDLRDVVSMFKVAFRYLKHNGKVCFTLFPYESQYDDIYSQDLPKKHSFKSQLVSTEPHYKLRTITFYDKLTSSELFEIESTSYCPEILITELTSLGFSEVTIKPLSLDPKTPKAYSKEYFQEFTADNGLCVLLEAIKR